MRHYAAEVRDNGVEWASLTTELPRTLVPLLDGFDVILNDIKTLRLEDRAARRADP